MTRALIAAAVAWSCLWAVMSGAASAAPRVSLMALSPDGTRAVLTYNQDWVEVALDVTGAQRLDPPAGCRWTSMAYAPEGIELGMTAYCPASQNACRAVQSLLLAAGPDRSRYRLLADITGARWSDVYWRGGGRDILALERRLTPRMATNLADLGKTTGGCETAPPALVSLGVEDGRRAVVDLLPPDWRIKGIVAADPVAMIAEVAMRRGGPPEITAAARLDAICEATPQTDLCRSAGVAVELFWKDGDWRFASPPDQARLGRMVASADLSVIGRERCEARWVENRFRPVCDMTVSRGEQTVTITAPEGLFGDLALSPNGRWMLAVASGIGRRLTQFDLFDTETGTRQAFPHLLTLSPPFTGLPVANP